MPSIKDIKEARKRLSGYIHRTPVLTSRTIDAMAGREVFFKCENLQKCGAFKIRGAGNAILSLSGEEASRGVATHSSGNHAAAVAQAASWRGINSYVVMPRTASEVKRKAVRSYGAEIFECGPTLESREKALAGVVADTGAHFVHPYDDLMVVSGQGTAALELLEQAGPLDSIVVPVGGGGLASGTAVCAAAISPNTAVLAAEPGGADDAYRSFKSGKLVPSVEPDTIADGLLTSLSDLTFSIISRYAEDIVTVSDEAIIEAMKLVWERMKIVIEPSAAVPLATILTRRAAAYGNRVGVILSGGNVDLSNLPF